MSQASASDTYAAAIDYLYRRINYEQTPPGPYRRRKINLEPMRRLLDELGNPQQRIPVVHVAGTKGKGSTAAMISSVLSQAGWRTGLYTSPHLVGLEDRYRINGSRCTPHELVALTDVVRPAVTATERQLASGQGLTFFEVTTAMAWLHFQRQAVDIAVIEVGLGGRLDSTNLCSPLVCVITSISYDHTRQLGNTLAAIAREKAGIIKPGVPVVSGVTAAEPREVIDQVARQQGAPLYVLGTDFQVDERRSKHPREFPQRDAWFDYAEDIEGRRQTLDDVQLGLIGAHQVANAGVALAACHRLQAMGWPLPEEALRSGLAQVRCAARIEVVRHRPTVILDTAHNVASIEALVNTLRERFPPGRRTFIFAASHDKDVEGMLRTLLPAADTVVFTQFHKNPRAVPADELLQLARHLSAARQAAPPREAEAASDPAERAASPQSAESPAAEALPGPRPRLAACATPAEAWRTGIDHCDPDGLLCITGSFFLAAEMGPLAAAEPPAS